MLNEPIHIQPMLDAEELNFHALRPSTLASSSSLTAVKFQN